MRKEAPVNPLYDDGFVLLPSYMGNRHVTLRIGEVPNRFSMSMVLDCVFKRMEDEVSYRWTT